MKYKNIFVTSFMLLFCIGFVIGMTHTSVYGDTDHHGNHCNHSDQGDMHGDMTKTRIRGIVSSVSGTTISIFNMDIDASDAEVMLMHCDESLSVDDIVQGDIVEAKGNMINGSFVASIIKLEGAGVIEGTVEAIGTDTVTLLGKSIDTNSAYCIKRNVRIGRKARVTVRNADSGLTALAIKATGMMEME
ncbi:MAG: DUF5666 domain-containing protein [Candidatus Brocadiales bacterium]|nr:DUF5666 domain-containing protein [Candidatus Brocadiales bacterium]